MPLHYNIDYEIDGKKYTQTKIWSSSPGTAFAEVQNRYPECKLIKAWKEGMHDRGYQEWFPPKVQRPLEPAPRPVSVPKRAKVGCEFPFYDEVVRRDAGA
jgi:hypothetical protein